MTISRDDLIKFLNRKTRADISGVGDQTELFSTGTIDSFAMIDLMTWLEKNKVKVGPEDVSYDNFDTVERILTFAAANARNK
ncbi:acyl carrier protein [Pseudenhygromyxa sp. WMMC2535]|uniref:phosphopantetheine-binding protein n=1 Tax=Pseudenhygromyxa sp. WMMC2535 TaxID=2712867 RepID=UPI001551DB6A|nr:acyl carrier protein [Pseudenhygromyxa sp. WMMC2535]